MALKSLKMVVIIKSDLDCQNQVLTPTIDLALLSMVDSITNL